MIQILPKQNIYGSLIGLFGKLLFQAHPVTELQSIQGYSQAYYTNKIFAANAFYDMMDITSSKGSLLNDYASE